MILDNVLWFCLGICVMSTLMMVFANWPRKGDVERKKYFYAYSVSGITIHATNLEELKRQIKELKENEI